MNDENKDFGGSQTELTKPLKQKSSSFDGILFVFNCVKLIFDASRLNPGLTVKTRANGAE